MVTMNPTLEELKEMLRMVESWHGSYDDLKNGLRREIKEMENKSK